jgi:succinyl-CoA synthetase alpha subunit
MAKRTFWLVTGVAIGTGSTLWAERKVRRTVQQAAARLQPDALVVEVGRSARQVAGSAGDRVREAVWSGRDEMERHEEELWAELASRGVETAHTPSSEHRERERGGRRRGFGSSLRPLTRAGTRAAGGPPR